MPHRFVLRQLFDIRPLKEDGSLDLEKIKNIKEIVNFKPVPEVEFLNNDIADRDSVLAELMVIDERERRLKMILSNAAPASQNRRIIYVKDKTDPRKRMIKIHNLTRREPEKNIWRLLTQSHINKQDFEEKAQRFFEKPLKITEKLTVDKEEVLPQIDSKENLRRLAPTIVVSCLLILNLFLAKDFLAAGLPASLREALQAGLAKVNALPLGSIISVFERGDDGGVAALQNFALIKNLVADYGVIFKFLGFERPQKYLLIFQNNSEMRATGGFIGSYGVLDIDRGKIKNFFIDDVYNIDGQLQEKIAPPAPLLRVADFWSMHDANWYADFPASAKKIAWFYEKTGGPTVDGVISLTPTVVEKILKITGPVELSEYDSQNSPLIITADNFIEEFQYKIEKDFDKELNQPKKILADFGANFFTKLQAMPKNVWPNFLAIFNQMSREKHILFYFSDQQLENFAVNQGWAGELKNASGDYLSVVNSNLAGGKTDLFIEEKIEQQAELQSDGSVIDTVKIFRYHQGGKTKYEWWNAPNADYLRIYVPDGSTLLAINGAEVLQENGKTIFAKWVTTKPGETTVTEFKYLVPARFWHKYSILIQKQSGSLGSNYKLTVKLPQGEWKNEAILNEDKYFEIEI